MTESSSLSERSADALRLEARAASASRWSALAEQAAIALLFVVLSIVLTWPLAARLETAVSDLGDPLLNAWILNWDQYAAVHHPTQIYQAPIFYPSKYPLAYSENLFGISALLLPFYLLGFSPLVVYNLAMIGGFAFAGWAGAILARETGAGRFSAILAGVLYAFVQFRLDHLAHLQIVWSGWLPLMLAALLRYRRHPTKRVAVLAALTVLMNGLTNVHWLLFGTMALGITLAFLMIVDRRPLLEWAALIIAYSLALGCLVPVLLPYRTVSNLYQMRRDRNEALGGSADWTDWLVATPMNATYGDLPEPEKSNHERRLFPGLVSLLCTAAAIVVLRRKYGPVQIDSFDPPRWLLRTLDTAIVVATIVTYFGAISPNYVFRLFGFTVLDVQGAGVPAVVLVLAILSRLFLALPGAWQRNSRTLGDVVRNSRLPVEFWICALWVVIGVLGSFGVKGFFHDFLYRRVTVFQSIRVPARWAMIAYTGLIGTGAAGLTWLMERGRSPLKRAVVLVLLCACVFLDIRPRIRWEQAVPDLAPVYRWLIAENVHAPLLELPVEAGQYAYQLSATAHHLPLLDGVSGFEPPLHRQIREGSERQTIPASFSRLIGDAGCQLVIVHEDWLHELGVRTHQWIAAALQRGELTFVGRFDHGVGGDWVFAVNANHPIVPPQSTLSTGAEPEKALAGFLAGEATYNSTAFGYLESPQFYEEMKKPALIRGWALSSQGIGEVDVLLNAGRMRFRAKQVARGDITARYPWYPLATKPGFELTLLQRPKGIPRQTDLQVELIELDGKRTRLPDVFIQWP
jgi:hypothetical protein